MPFPSTAVETLRIDLAQGTGRSPWGGKVTLTSVEEIRDTDGRDVILGSGRGDTVQSDYGGGDVLKLRGGDDTVRIFEQAENLTYDGGAGRDTLMHLAGLRRQHARPRRPGAANAGGVRRRPAQRRRGDLRLVDLDRLDLPADRDGGGGGR